MIIDAHHHLWNPARGDYDWMPKDEPVLNRVYNPDDLRPILKQQETSATIMVQAAASVEETEYMLGLADATDFIAGVVGWVDFENPDHLHHLRRLAKHPKFLGVRPMIQDIPDENWMLREDVQWGFEELCKLDLSLDALGFPKHLANFHALLTRYPEMRVVIDHCAKPEIRNQDDDHFAFWADGMTRLAQDTNAHVKLSGLVTEDVANWSVERLRRYGQHVVRTFGPERTMWGSDWPVCRLRCEYEDWLSAARELVKDMDVKAQKQIFSGTAIGFYRLSIA